MKDMLCAYEEALKLTNEQIAEIKEQINNKRITANIYKLEKKLFIAMEQQLDIVKTINGIKSYIEERGSKNGD